MRNISIQDLVCFYSRKLNNKNRKCHEYDHAPNKTTIPKQPKNHFKVTASLQFFSSRFRSRLTSPSSHRCFLCLYLTYLEGSVSWGCLVLSSDLSFFSSPSSAGASCTRGDFNGVPTAVWCKVEGHIQIKFLYFVIICEKKGYRKLLIKKGLEYWNSSKKNWRFVN